MIIVSQFAPIALFYIMLCIGMSTNIKNFVKVFKDYKTLLVGLTSQIVILPFIGILFAIFLTNDPVLKVGIILIICMPSAVTSNYVTKLANGNITLSVSLTAITASLSFITIPFMFTVISPILINETIVLQNLDFKKMSLSLLFITTIPVFIGMFINTKFLIFVEKINKFYSIFSLLLFISIIFTAWISEWNVIIGLYKSIGFLVTALAAVVLFTSYTLVNLLNINEANKKTIVIETFIQNAAMAIIVGGVTFGPGSGYLAIAALYALFQYKIILFLWATNKFLRIL